MHKDHTSLPESPPPVDWQRLRWQCRRGLLELDILLGDFLETRYAGLAVSQQADFVHLLSYPDQQLLHWFTDQETPPLEVKNIIKQVRDHHPTSGRFVNRPQKLRAAREPPLRNFGYFI